MNFPGSGKVRVEVTRAGAWVFGIVDTVVAIAFAVFGLHFWAGLPADATGARVFLVVWFAVLIGGYLNALRLIHKRSFTWRGGSGAGIPASLMTFHPVPEPERPTAESD